MNFSYNVRKREKVLKNFILYNCKSILFVVIKDEK